MVATLSLRRWKRLLFFDFLTLLTERFRSLDLPCRYSWIQQSPADSRSDILDIKKKVGGTRLKRCANGEEELFDGPRRDK